MESKDVRPGYVWLLLLTAVVLLPLMISLPSIRFLKRQRAEEIRTNEEAVMLYLVHLHCLQRAFRESGVKDLDRDGKGEYGVKSEILEWLSQADPQVGSFVQLWLEKEAHPRGYEIVMHLDDALCKENVKLHGNGEERFCAIAFPMQYGVTGKRSFLIDQTGMVSAMDLGRQGTASDFFSRDTRWASVEAVAVRVLRKKERH